MFKQTSDNMQRRVRHKLQHAKLDLSVFKTVNEIDLKKMAIDDERAEIQQKISLINQQISSVSRRARDTGMFIHQRSFDALDQDRKDLVASLHKLEALQRELKKARTSFRPAAEEAFSLAFMKMAKAMLADDVYMRVIAAATHYCAEADSPK